VEIAAYLGHCPVSVGLKIVCGQACLRMRCLGCLFETTRAERRLSHRAVDLPVIKPISSFASDPDHA
jgi:hypothetical protein